MEGVSQTIHLNDSEDTGMAKCRQTPSSHYLKLVLTTILTGIPTNLNTMINKIPAKETRSKTREDRILPTWYSAKRKQSFINRTVKSLNAMSKDIFMIYNSYRSDTVFTNHLT